MSDISDYFLKKAEELGKNIRIEIFKTEKKIEVACCCENFFLEDRYSKLVLKDKGDRHQLGFVDFNIDPGDYDGRNHIGLVAVVKDGIVDKVYAPWYDEEEIDKGDSYKKAIDFMFKHAAVRKEYLEVDIAKSLERMRKYDEGIMGEIIEDLNHKKDDFIQRN